MAIIRLTSEWTGPQIRGGGVTQSYFNDAAGTAQDACDALDAFWADVINTVKSGNSVQINPQVLGLDETDGSLNGQTIVTPAGPHNGTNSGEPLPPASQMLLRWFTPQVANNRLIRGHWFLPAQTDGANTSAGQVDPGTIAAVVGSMQDLIDDADSQLAIWHRPNGSSAGSVGAVDSAGVWNEWAVLRSRRD